MKKSLLVFSFIFLIAGSLLVQVTITGQVKNLAGDPLPGVSIAIKGSSTGTVTDIDGKYTMKDVPADATLVFSFLGMLREEVVVGKQSVINVTLLEDIKTLQEVVVVGYGTQKRANITSAVEVVNPKDVQDLPVSNLGAALRGMVNGLSVSGGMERPGVAATLSIRSPITISKDGGTAAPLLIIDDVIQIDGSTTSQAADYSVFNTLDPSEIESITILKDGAAAIYGARSSQGAVIVTTKKGKLKQAPRISYTGLYGWNDATRHPKTLSAYQEGIWWNEYAGPYGANRSTSSLRNFFQPDELDSMKNMDYNWLKHIWKVGNNVRHTLSISGGSDKATYFGSATYYTQNGNLTTGDYNKWTFRAGTNVNVTSNFKTGIQLSGTNTYIKNPFNKVGGENLNNDYVYLIGMPKYFPYDVDGQYTYLMLNPYTYPGANANDMSAFNYFQMQNSDNFSEVRGMTYTINLNAEYDVPFVKGLSFKGLFSRTYDLDINNQIGTQYTLLRPTQLAGTGQHLYLPSAEGAIYSSDVNSRNGNRMLFDRNYDIRYQANFFINYEKQIGKHNVTGMFSTERMENDYNSSRLIALNPLPDNNGQTNTATGGIDPTNSLTGRMQSGGLSYLGRATYNYDNKYNFTFLIRSDASTKFAPSHYWGTFYSIGGAWVASDENFFKDNIRFVDYLKIRASIGLTGKDNTRAWQWRQRYTYQGDKGSIFGTSVTTVPTIGYKMEVSPNPDATWDNDTKLDIGLDATFLKGRLSTTFDVWRDHNYNILGSRTGTVPVSVGGSYADENYAAENAYGIELTINWKDNITRDLSYNVNFMTGWSDTKILKYDMPAVVYPWTPNQPGRPADDGVWGYDCLGMFRSQPEIDDYVKKYLTKADGTTGTMFGLAATALKPGMLYYRDVRGQKNPGGGFQGPDGIIDNNDQIKLAKKKNNPYGFTTNLGVNFKGIQLSAQLSANWGGWSVLDGTTQSSSSSAFVKDQAYYWREMYDPDLNPNGKYPNQYQYNNNNQTVTSKFWEIPAFRMQLRTITLAYELPKSLLNKAKINGLRFNLTMTNVASLYNPYNYRDPLTDMNGYPVLRTVSLGVNLTL